MVSIINLYLDHDGEMVGRSAGDVFPQRYLFREVRALLLLVAILHLHTIRVRQDSVALHLELLRQEDMINSAVRLHIGMEVIERAVRRVLEIRYLIRIPHTYCANRA